MVAKPNGRALARADAAARLGPEGLPAFRARVQQIVTPAWGGVGPSDLMACMAFESACTFSPSVRNGAGSGAVGLIQFMPQTAAMLGTSIEALARMTAEDQLTYVARYFAPQRGRLHNLGDLYCAILWPAGIGKADNDVLFGEGGARPALYLGTHINVLDGADDGVMRAWAASMPA